MTESQTVYRALAPEIHRIDALNKEVEGLTLQPLTPEELIETLGSTVKHDNTNKVITFLVMLCNYTDTDQTNLGFIADSSTGKSYIPLEVSLYFPREDIIELAYCSPTAFFHEQGTWVFDPEDLKLEPEQRRKKRCVNLEKKIIIFLDQPHSQLLQNLRPMFSHDRKEMTLKITNKSEKSGNRAENITIRGFPTVVHCTANYQQDEQEKTRMLLLSPEHSEEKLREAIALKIQREGNREAYEKKLESNPKLLALKLRVQAIKEAHIGQVIIPDELQSHIYKKFLDEHEYLQSRNQRDITRLLTLIKGSALLNYQQRNPVIPDMSGKTNITATLEDVEVGFKYYDAVSTANELGIPPEVYEIYQLLKAKAINPEFECFSRKQFQALYFSVFHKPIGRDDAARKIEALETAGLIVEASPNPHNLRTKNYMCVGVGVQKDRVGAMERDVGLSNQKGAPHPSRAYSLDQDPENKPKTQPLTLGGNKP